MTKEQRNNILMGLFKHEKGYNGFYNAAGILYRIAEFAFLFVLIVYLALSAIWNLGGITYANAEYMVRNFVITLDGNKRSVSEIMYNPDADMSFALAAEGLSVCGNTGCSSFSATGRKTLSDNVDFHKPCVRASSKYTISFENGGKKFIVYNGFSRVYSEETENPIYDISVADNGTFAVLSSLEGSVSVVSVYDSDFSLISRIRRTSYVLSAQLGQSGSGLLVTETSVSSSGLYSALVTEYQIGKDVEKQVINLGNVFPMKSVYSGDYIVTVCADRVFFTGTDGKTIQVEYPDGTLSGVNVSSSYLCALFENSNDVSEKYRISVISPDGTTQSALFDAGYVSMTSYADKAYLLMPEGIRSFENGVFSEPILIHKEYSSDSVLLSFSEKRLYLCSKSAAYVIGVE